MAKLFQTQPFVLPDFSAIEQQAQDAQFNRQMQLDNYLSQFQQEQGFFLAGHKGAVQESYDAVKNAMDSVAANPRDLSARRQLREAQSNHVQVAGAARFLAEQYRTENAFAVANPEKIAMDYDTMFQRSKEYESTQLNADEIMQLASSGTPYSLDKVISYQVSNPEEHATNLVGKSEKLIGDWVNPVTGAIDEEKARKYVRENLNSVLGNQESLEGADLEELERAIVWSRNSRGYNGIPGRIGGQDLSKIRTLSADDKVESINYYRTKAEDAFMRELRRYIDDKRTIYRQNLSDRRQAAGTGSQTASKQIIVEKVDNQFEIPEGMFSSVGTAYLAENQRGTYDDPQSKKTYKITQMVKGVDGKVYGVALSKGQDGIYDVDAGSELKMIPINRDVLLRGFSTSERPYIVDAYTTLLNIQGPSVRQGTQMGPMEESSYQEPGTGISASLSDVLYRAAEVKPETPALPADATVAPPQPAQTAQKQQNRMAFTEEELRAAEAAQRARITGR